jgi:hypothetical protein
LAQSAIDILLFLHVTGDGRWVVVACSFGDLADQFGPAVLQLTAA